MKKETYDWIDGQSEILHNALIEIARKTNCDYETMGKILAEMYLAIPEEIQELE